MSYGQRTMICIHFIQVIIYDLFQWWNTDNLKTNGRQICPMFCLMSQESAYDTLVVPLRCSLNRHISAKHNYSDTHIHKNSCIHSNMLTLRHKHMHMDPAHLWPTFICCSLRGYLWGEVSRDWGFSFPTFWLP